MTLVRSSAASNNLAFNNGTNGMGPGVDDLPF